jgi:hypothetical protein
MDVKIVNLVRELRGLSIRELARRTGSVQPRNLASHFAGQSGKVSQEKLSGVCRVLDLSENGLVSGIHRWVIPSPMASDMEKAEYLIRELCPGGVIVYPIQPKTFFPQGISENIISLNDRTVVLVPMALPLVRIVLAAKLVFGTLYPVSSCRFVNLKYFGGVLPDGSSPEEIPSSAWIPLPPEILDRIKSDSDLTVPDLDAILGISVDSGWTWERLTAVLQGKGMTPEEAARKMGIL